MKIPSRRLVRWRGSLAFAAVLLVIGFGALELYARLREPGPYRADVYDEEGKLTARDLDDPILGYVPRPDRQFRMRGYFEDRLVLDFPYSINANGLRASSSGQKIQSERCILFFGGSTPFGEGVPDNETVPSLIAEVYSGKYSAHNFGYFYYGGHQMLAAIEIGRLDDIIDCKPAYAIYFGYVAHVERASYIGVPYSERIPQYVLDNQGAPVLVRRTNALLSLMAIVRSSKVLRRLDRTVANALEGASIGQDDVDMYIKIVDRARQILESGYPGVEFHVIFWDEKGKEPSEYIIRNLIDRGIKVHLISWIFPNYDYNTMKYRLGPEYMVNEVTWHINGKGYTKIADYIASSIVD